MQELKDCRAALAITGMYKMVSRCGIEPVRARHRHGDFRERVNVANSGWFGATAGVFGTVRSQPTLDDSQYPESLYRTDGKARSNG